MEALGWENPDAAGFYLKHIVSIEPVNGVKLYVHHAAAPIFRELARGLEKLGANLPARRDDWSYDKKGIEGYPPQYKSYHAWGLACDFNATQNVMGSPHTSFPVAKTRELVKSLRFVVWGYEWQSTRPDPMHFEIRGTKDEVKAFSAHLRRS